MASQNLTHAAFWDRMDRATRHVGKFPDWVKGSPSNQRLASPDSCQDQSTVGTGKDAASNGIQEPPPLHR
jgi:uncharacterized membrane protein YdfJ with MMPL/SSD domain